MSQNQRDSEQDDGFYNQINKNQPNEDQIYEAPSRRALKKKMIKKRIQMGKFTSTFKLILEKETQQKKRNESLNSAVGSALELIDQMKKCYEKDLRLYKLKKKASTKLRYVKGLQKRLNNIYVGEKFLDHGGLDCFQSWIRKLPDGTDSSLTLKKKVFSIILSLDVGDDHIQKASVLRKQIMKNKKNNLLKDLCESIMNKWGRNWF